MKRSQLKRKPNGRCAHCGKEYRRPPSQIGKYCSRECADAAGARGKGPQHQRKGEQRECLACGTTFYAKRVEINRGGGKYCSRACWRAKPPKRSASGLRRVREIGRQREGRKNPNYKHGKRAGGQIRGFTLAEKGERTCRHCGREAVHAHHAVPRSLSPEGRRDLRNCLPLCARCHVRWHHGQPIPRNVFTEKEWAYITTLIGPTWLDKRYPDHELRLMGEAV